MSYFPPFIHSKDKMEVELDLSNYATKSNLQNATCGDTSLFARKDDLANLKSEVDQIGIDKLFESDANKLERVYADISNLSRNKENDVKEKDYNANLKDIVVKIPSITNVTINTALEAKIKEIKGEIPRITNLATLPLLLVLKIKYLTLGI